MNLLEKRLRNIKWKKCRLLYQGKFQSVNTLRSQLELIPKQDCPFLE